MRSLCIVALLLSIAGPLMAQQGGFADTTKKAQVKEIRPGLELPDSLYVPQDTLKGDIDTIVRYTAKDSIVFDVPMKRMTLVNNARVQFQSRDLEAYTIVMDFNASTLTAYSENVDSVLIAQHGIRRKIIHDTARTKSRGAPILHEGATPYEGEVIVYNFKTHRGTVELGTTEMEGGFYFGEKIKQVAPATLFVENGRYTTCDAPTPHYYFESPKMKVIMQDKVFAEPVYLYVADVPIFALPFGVFPNHSGGRHTGLIPPSYQTVGDRGFGLTHLGWYQVFSDYFDAAVKGDLYTKGGYNIDGNLQWMRRYWLNSPATLHVGYGFTRTNSIDPFIKNWAIDGMLPNLELTYNQHVNVDLHFASNEYNQNTALNYRQALQQSITSRASYSLNLEDLGVNVSVDYSREQHLIRTLKNDAGSEYEEGSPTLSIAKTQFFPFASSNSSSEPNVLSTFGVGYALRAERHLTRDTLNIGDSMIHYKPTLEQYGVLHSPSISISPRFSHFTITPSVSYGEAWFFREHHRKYYLDIRRDTLGRPIDSTTRYTDSVTPGFHRAYRWNAGVGIQTALFGVANIGLLGIQAIRHAISPSLSFNYTPSSPDENLYEFTDPKNNRLQHYTLYEGEINSSQFGIHDKSASMSFGLNNDFEAKVERQVSADSTAVDKVKLLNLSVRTGYDFISTRLSDVTLSTHSSIGTTLNFHGDASYSFYPLRGSGLIDTVTLIKQRAGFLQARTISFGLDGNFSSSETTEGENYDSLRRMVDIQTPDDEREMLLGGFFPGRWVNVPFRPKWTIGYGISYQRYNTLQGPNESYTGHANFTLGITKNWSLTSSAEYDFQHKKIVVPEISVYRDLHCWEMRFGYRPPGSAYSGFNLEIRVKAPQLQDVKLTRTENTYGEF